jgi:DNA-binding transcriptional ArsR family regulator
VATQEQFEPVVDVLKALAEPTRLRLVWSLSQREQSVGELAELVGANVAAVSQHLARLREAGLVASRRDGTRIFYRASTPHVAGLLEHLVVMGGHVADDRIDRGNDPSQRLRPRHPIPSCTDVLATPSIP